MKPTIKEFIDTLYPDLYQYQKDYLKYISLNNEPFNYHKIMLKQRQNERLYLSRLNLYWNLFNYNDILDVFHSLIFRHVINPEGKLELQIDEYSQTNNSVLFTILDENGEDSIPVEVLEYEVMPKLRKFTDELNKALSVIKEIV